VSVNVDHGGVAAGGAVDDLAAAEERVPAPAAARVSDARACKKRSALGQRRWLGCWGAREAAAAERHDSIHDSGLDGAPAGVVAFAAGEVRDGAVGCRGGPHEHARG
jgi:hypothetical protein